MKILYLDCFSGISGDMFLAALIDAGLPLRVLKKELAKLRIGGYSISARKMKVAGHLAATAFSVRMSRARHNYRSPAAIERIIKCSGLSEKAKGLALAIFVRLKEAEARSHGSGHGNVHFHEIGDIDSIVDIIGAAIGITALGIERVYVSDVAVGRGILPTRAGVLPIPCPAALNLLKGFRVAFTGAAAEMVTPTGAAILSAVAEQVDSIPPVEIERIGCGAGTRVIPGRPNMLRAVLGRQDTCLEGDISVVIETNIDDMSPVNMGGLYDCLLAAGALDVFLTPVQMKKGRPGFLLSVVAQEGMLKKLSEIIFRETTTTGVRYHRAGRYKLRRETAKVITRYGRMRVKVRHLPGGGAFAMPEYEDCRRAASKRGVPFAAVYEEAKNKAGRYGGKSKNR